MEKLTRFEETRLISARALQLALGAPAFVKPDKSPSVIDLAEKELRHNALPLMISPRKVLESVPTEGKLREGG